jgi:hypothetical protein
LRFLEVSEGTILSSSPKDIPNVGLVAFAGVLDELLEIMWWVESEQKDVCDGWQLQELYRLQGGFHT